MISKRRISLDLVCVIVLVALCWLFYWRLLTGDEINRQSLVEGDFSGQFVAFAHYQAVRLGQGQVPLWNPYTYSGHPFLADTQSAVFYPPRLVTVALLNLTGGSTPGRMYDALQKEMVAHALLASLLMYAFIRRITAGGPSSYVAGMVAGLTFAYGGYLTAYPQLQLAVMEAGIWLPLALLGIHQATVTERRRWIWFMLAGAALALSLMAGHPQTTLFFGYLSAAYLGWRVYTTRAGRPVRQSWLLFIAGLAIFGIVGVGLAAVQLLPAAEYLRLTTRSALNFDALGNGFPFYDVLQMLFPGFMSLWSPLYCGIVGLALAIYAVWRRADGAIFWAGAGLLALGLSFGHGTVIYDLFYTLAPGFTLFRGQERSAYVVAVSLSVLAGLGTVELLKLAVPRRFKIAVYAVLGLAAALCAILYVNWLVTPGADARRLGLVAFSLIVMALLAVLITDERQWRWRPVALVGLVVFELFSFGRTNPNLEPRSPATRLPLPALVQAALADQATPFRVDGARGLRENYSALYGLADIRGISPLRLATVERLEQIPASRVWEVLGVRYVFTDNAALPVQSTVIGKGSDPQGDINLHKLADPRPFAMLVYKTWIEANDDAARGILSEPSYDVRNTVILPTDPGVTLKPEDHGTATVTGFAPEQVTIQTSSPSSSILRVAQVYYPGWEATLDGQPAPILRADTALTAVVVPPGDHTVQLTYRPASYALGALISLGMLIIVLLAGVLGLATARKLPGIQHRLVANRPLLAALVGLTLGASAAVFGLLIALGGPLIPFALLIGLAAGLYVLTDLTAALYVTFGLVAVLPFASLPVKVAVTPTLIDVGLGAFFLVYLFQWMTGRRSGFKLVPAHGLILLFMLWTIFSFVAGLGHAALTPTILRRFLELILSMIFAMVLIDIARDTQALRRIALVILIFGTAQALAGIILTVINDATAERILNTLGRFGYPQGGVIRYIDDNPALAERAIGTWVDPNAYGGFLLMVAALAGSQILAERPVTGRRWLALAMFGIMALAVWLTQSRGALIALGCAGLFIAMLRYRWLLVAIAVIAAVLVFLPFTQTYIDRFVEGLTGQDLSTQMRFGEYKDALILISRYPVMGVGFAGSPDRDIYLGVSSVYLKVAGGTGLVGLALFLITIGETFRYGLRRWSRLLAYPELANVWLGFTAGFAGAVVGGIFDHYYFNIEFHAAGMMFWAFMGLSLAAARRLDDFATQPAPIGTLSDSGSTPAPGTTAPDSPNAVLPVPVP